jgi:hypothetical protein
MGNLQCHGPEINKKMFICSDTVLLSCGRFSVYRVPHKVSGLGANKKSLKFKFKVSIKNLVAQNTRKI